MSHFSRVCAPDFVHIDAQTTTVALTGQCDISVGSVVQVVMNMPDYELTVVSIKPHDHSEGTPRLTFIHVYVPGPKLTRATFTIVCCYIFFRIFADFQNDFCLLFFFVLLLIPITVTMPVTSLYIPGAICQVPNQKKNTLDKCYGNVPGAYPSECRPPLGKSDHKVILLIPKDNENAHKMSKHEHTKF